MIVESQTIASRQEQKNEDCAEDNAATNGAVHDPDETATPERLVASMLVPGAFARRECRMLRLLLTSRPEYVPYAPPSSVPVLGNPGR